MHNNRIESDATPDCWPNIGNSPKNDYAVTRIIASAKQKQAVA
jgi:hypothetical protein